MGTKHKAARNYRSRKSSRFSCRDPMRIRIKTDRIGKEFFPKVPGGKVGSLAGHYSVKHFDEKFSRQFDKRSRRHL